MPLISLPGLRGQEQGRQTEQEAGVRAFSGLVQAPAKLRFPPRRVGAHQESRTASSQHPPALSREERFPPGADWAGPEGAGSCPQCTRRGRGGQAAVGPLATAEQRRVEPGAEAGQSGGRSRRSCYWGRSGAVAAVVTREWPGPYDPGRSSAIQVLGSPREVGGRLGTLARAGMERWRDRLALVTGASGGVGAAVARALVQQGLKVVGCARTVSNIEVRPCWGKGRSGWRRLGRARVQVGDGEWSEPSCHAALTCPPPQGHLQQAQGQERRMPRWRGPRCFWTPQGRTPPSLFKVQSFKEPFFLTASTPVYQISDSLASFSFSPTCMPGLAEEGEARDQGLSQGEGKKAFPPQWLSWLLDCFLWSPDLARKAKQSEQVLIMIIFTQDCEWGWGGSGTFPKRLSSIFPRNVRVSPYPMDIRDKWDI